MRNATGEVEAAAAGPLPRLVERSHILGDFHLHTTYSDGQDTVEAMVASAAALGYEYVAITDHSMHAAASRTMSPEQVVRQREEIDRLRASVVVGMPMPPSLAPGAAFGEDGAAEISAWLLQGAPTPDCLE